MANKNPIVLVVEDDQVAEQASFASEPPLAIDAIAIGVEAKLDPFSAYSKIVTQRTIEIARQLSIAEEEIQRWVRVRAELDSKRGRAIKSEFNRS